jgi:hypothetical protein
MFKEILRYSLLSLLVLMVEFECGLFFCGIDSKLLLIPPVIIIAAGTFLFYRKDKDNDKRVMKSLTILLSSLFLTCLFSLIGITLDHTIRVLIFSFQTSN